MGEGCRRLHMVLYANLERHCSDHYSRLHMVLYTILECDCSDHCYMHSAFLTPRLTTRVALCAAHGYQQEMQYSKWCDRLG